MADLPIIFSGGMVRALLAGTKTQTRRLMPHQEELRQAYAPMISAKRILNYAGEEIISEARYSVGDRLWVREACQAQELSVPQTTRPATRLERKMLGRTSVVVFDDNDGADGVHYFAGEAWIRIENTQKAGDAWSEMHYYGQGRGTGPRVGRKVPSIHMPRWASRLTLIVTDVRVQRLQEINEEDAMAEGLQRALGGWWSGAEGQAGATPRSAFAVLWNSLHGAESWAANPWVVALTFDVEHRNIEAP